MKKQFIQLSVIMVVFLVLTIVSYLFNAPMEVKIAGIGLTLLFVVIIPVSMYEHMHKNRFIDVKLKSFDDYIKNVSYQPFIENDSSFTNRIGVNEKQKYSMFNNILKGIYKERKVTISQYAIQLDLGEKLSEYEYYTGFYVKVDAELDIPFNLVINSNTDISTTDLPSRTKEHISNFIEELGHTDETHITTNLIILLSDSKIEVFIDGFTPFTMIDKKSKYMKYIKELFVEVDRVLNIVNSLNSKS